MAKRKLKQNQKSSDDEIESRRPAKQFKKQNISSTEICTKNNQLSSKEVHDSSEDSDICNLDETSGTVADDIKYESFSSFLESFSFCFNMNDSGHQKFNGTSQNTSNECGISMNDSKSGESFEQVSHPASSSHENVLKEKLAKNIRVLPVPSKLSQVYFLQNPASLTLHGYVDVAVWFGSIRIFGYEMKKGEKIKVFSTEGTGLKKVVTSGTKHEFEMEVVKKKLKKLTCYEDIDVEKYSVDIETSCVLVVTNILLPAPLRFLELYYPNALQTRWPSSAYKKVENLELYSAEQSYVIDVSGDFESLSKEVNKVIRQPVSDNAAFGHRILVCGEKNTGKSTLIKYLMNSSLNKFEEVYFLDTDPGQTEYTPPGVVSLFRVTKPLLGPSFAHQKKPLRMIFTGSVTPGTSPKLYEDSVIHLMKYFNHKFCNKILFVNTMGWIQGVGGLCLKNIKSAVKPTIEIEIAPPDPDTSLTKEVVGNEVTVFKVPSKAPSRESGAPYYSAAELRHFNLVAYLGQCQKSFIPVSLINSFHPVCVSWDKIALHVMGKRVLPYSLVKAMHCSIVALCHVDLSCILKSDNADLPMTLYNDPICECLGFGLVRASDETNRLFYIVTPLTLDQLKNVNALIKGNVVVPDQILIKQTIENVALPYTNQSKSRVAKNLGLKPPKRGFRKLTPKNP